jgi:hypothetical protein
MEDDGRSGHPGSHRTDKNFGKVVEHGTFR